MVRSVLARCRACAVGKGMHSEREQERETWKKGRLIAQGRVRAEINNTVLHVAKNACTGWQEERGKKEM